MSVLDQLDEPTEAVIISGPHKGEFITIARDAPRGTEEELIITPEIEALLEQAIQTTNEINQTLRVMRQGSAEFREEMAVRRRERNEFC